MIEVRMVYPNERWVSEKTIRMWYADAVADGECEGGHTELEFMMRELMDIGHATFTTEMKGLVISVNE